MFNGFFSKQFWIIFNSSFFSINLIFETENRLCIFNFIRVDVKRFIKTLNQNKIPRHNELSTRMIKLCAFSISKPLHILFKKLFGKAMFPWQMEKSKYLILFTRNDISNWLIMISRNPYCQFILKCLRIVFPNISLNTQTQKQTNRQ